jgi:pimeloyl-ACP methyl ester carboxylesterase
MEQLEGTPRAGMRAAMCAYAWPNQPQSLGVPWEPVSLRADDSLAGRRSADQTELGWRFGAAENTDWVIFVHGRGGLRAQSFRALHRVLALGWTGLAITYRGAIEAGGGRNDLGAGEWTDLEDAVRLASEAGARRIVLAGFSMGGAIVAELLHRSPLAGLVSGVVLDAPVLDWQRVLEFHAQRMRLPSAIVPLALTAVHLRAGHDPRLLDQLRRDGLDGAGTAGARNPRRRGPHHVLGPARRGPSRHRPLPPGRARRSRHRLEPRSCRVRAGAHRLPPRAARSVSTPRGCLTFIDEIDGGNPVPT